jgi:hypothetical protein
MMGEILSTFLLILIMPVLIGPFVSEPNDDPALYAGDWLIILFAVGAGIFFLLR